MSLEDVSQLTFFCDPGAADPTLVVGRELEQHLPSSWQSTSGVVADRGLQVNRQLQAPGNEFARTLLGMLNALRSADPVSEQGFASAVHTIERCEVGLGVVFEPPLGTQDPRCAIAATFALELQAVVFDGHRVMNSNLDVVAQLTVR